MSRKLNLEELQEKSNLTKFQLQMWMGQKIYPNSPVLNVISTYSLSFEVDPKIFKRAVEEVSKRDEVFRTTFIEEDGVPQMRINPLGFSLVDYFDYSEEKDPHESFRILLGQRKNHNFQLLGGPLWGYALVKLGFENWKVIFSSHHIVADGGTRSLYFKRLFEIYEKLATGKEDEVNEIGSYPSYLDYVREDKEVKNSPEIKESESFWKEELKTPIEELNLYGRNSSFPVAKRTTENFRLKRPLSDELFQKIKETLGETSFKTFSKNQSFALFYMTAILSYFYRRNGNTTQTIGLPIHNRRTDWAKQCTGLILEVAPIKVQIEEGESFISLFNKVREKYYQVLKHYRYTTGNQMGRPYFTSMFNYHITSYPEVMGTKVPIDFIHQGHTMPVEEICFHIEGFGGNSATLMVDFNRDLFTEQEGGWVISHFINLLNSFSGDPSIPLKRPSFISSEEKEILKFSPKVFENGRPLPQIIEDQALRNPNKVALRLDGQSLTYEELNNRSNQVAHHLLKEGIKVGAGVGLFFEISFEMFINLIGINKTGGYFIPLDPENADERIEMILKDSGAKKILSQKSLTNRIPKDFDSITLFYEDLSLEEESQENPKVEISGEDLIYSIYTSGSTGRPKGALLTHKNVFRLFQSSQDYFKFGPTDIWTMFHSISFDFSVWEYFGAFYYGGTLCLVPKSISRSPKKFYKLLEEEKVTVLSQTPSAFYRLIKADEALERKSELALKNVIFGGETLEFSALEGWSKRHPKTLLINGYGITETSIFTTYYKLSPEEIRTRKSSLIGRPVSDTPIFIFDENDNELPIGDTGELYIGGPGVAKGYLKRPDLNDKVFIQHPSHGLLYKSGDLVRMHPCGNLEFIGRRDFQVKIRGYRIELGEIEAIMGSTDLFTNWSVMSLKNNQNEDRLVAFFSLKSNEKLNHLQLRKLLKSKLPAYMIPHNFIELEDFPITINGKVDRKKLVASFEAKNEQTNEESSPPEGEKERLVAGVWKEILGIKKIGRFDNFMDLGGNSVSSLEAIGKIKSETGVSISPQSLITDNLEQVAARLIVAIPSQEEAPLSFFQTLKKKLFS